MSAILMSPSFLAFAFSFSLLFCNLIPSHATQTDVYCLKSFLSSVEDPFGHLKSSWNFSNKTEGFVCKFKGVECWNSVENRVFSLNVHKMGLTGKFPPGLANCTSLTGLDLSGNNFSGPIPSNIAQILPYMVSLDLSRNGFSGEIPAGIANMSFVNALKLDNNRLAGRIPAQLGSLPRLRSFSVANNLLSGRLPEFSRAFPASSFEGNTGLCGPPLSPCSDKPTK